MFSLILASYVHLFLPPEEAVVLNGGTRGLIVLNGITSSSSAGGASVEPPTVDKKTTFSVDLTAFGGDFGLKVVDLNWILLNLCLDCNVHLLAYMNV